MERKYLWQAAAFCIKRIEGMRMRRRNLADLFHDRHHDFLKAAGLDLAYAIRENFVLKKFNFKSAPVKNSAELWHSSQAWNPKNFSRLFASSAASEKKKSHSDLFKAHREQLFIISNSFTHYRLSGIKQTRLVNFSPYLLETHVESRRAKVADSNHF